MKLQTYRRNVGVQEVVCGLVPDVVHQGSGLFPGIRVFSEDLADEFVVECAAYAIHEGRVGHDIWFSDDENNQGINMAFCISEATSSDLSDLRLLSAKAPAGAVIRTEEGEAFRVMRDGTVTNGSVSYPSLSAISARFTSPSKRVSPRCWPTISSQLSTPCRPRNWMTGIKPMSGTACRKMIPLLRLISTTIGHKSPK
ncbi:hypothetical protein [Dechloromonas sp. ZS-1]|uniref:hypothetical protein n=1 Tax=Dechloromonas sp. ZS-1 TaxID=3138067 RepID=UPI0031FD7981